MSKHKSLSELLRDHRETVAATKHSKTTNGAYLMSNTKVVTNTNKSFEVPSVSNLQSFIKRVSFSPNYSLI